MRLHHTALAFALFASATTHAAVTGLIWSEVARGSGAPANQRTFDLYAVTDTTTTIVLNADSGDASINLPPAGPNTGISSLGGRIVLVGSTQWPSTPGPNVLAADPGIEWSTTCALGTLVNDFALTQIIFLRPRTILDQGSGSRFTAAWADSLGDSAQPTPAPLPGGGQGVRVARVSVQSSATRLGGVVNIMGVDTQSRIYVGWTDLGVVGFGVFDVPNAIAPACPGDADDSGSVTFNDITIVLANLGVTYPMGGTGPGDADRNGAVTFNDITIVLANLGAPCN